MTHLGPRARELTGLGVAEPGDGRPLGRKAGARLRELISLRNDFLGDRLLANLEAPETGGLRGDGAACGADLADDVEVLVADPLHEGQPVEQILEAGGAEHDGDDVRRGGLVAPDELLCEHLLGVRLERLEMAETGAGGAQLEAQLVELGALCVDVGLDAAKPPRQDRDAGIEPGNAAGGGAHRPLERGDVSLAGGDPLLKLTGACGPSGGQARTQADDRRADRQRRQGGACDVREWSPSTEHR